MTPPCNGNETWWWNDGWWWQTALAPDKQNPFRSDPGAIKPGVFGSWERAFVAVTRCAESVRCGGANESNDSSFSYQSRLIMVASTSLWDG